MALNIDAKFEGKLTCAFKYDMRTSLTHSKVSELRLSMDSLAQSRKWVSLKFKGGLCVITMNNDAKFREELSCQFKMSHEEFNDFDRSSQKSQKYSL